MLSDRLITYNNPNSSRVDFQLSTACADKARGALPDAQWAFRSLYERNSKNDRNVCHASCAFSSGLNGFGYP